MPFSLLTFEFAMVNVSHGSAVKMINKYFSQFYHIIISPIFCLRGRVIWAKSTLSGHQSFLKDRFEISEWGVVQCSGINRPFCADPATTSARIRYSTKVLQNESAFPP